ncbi:MAG: AAA family ATPase [Thermoplasmataceae archaeon]
MIVVTGMPGSGKDEFIKVAKSMGWKDIHMGDEVRKYARINKIPSIDSEIGKFASSERAIHGKDIWARRVWDDLKPETDYIIDGLRNLEEFEYFRSMNENLVLIAIYTEREERLKRIIHRNRPDDIHSHDELVSRDDRELSWGIGNAISLANYMIVNDSTLHEFKLKSRELLGKLQKNII